jgi:hypothetical protein
MADADESLNQGFLKTIFNSELRDVAKDSAEVLVDSLLDDGVLKEIPIVRSVLGLAKAGVSVRDRLFLEKVMRVLSPLSKYSSEQRQEFLRSLDADEVKKASAYLILYIDRLDSIEKTGMLGKVFEAYLTGKIGYKTMLYFAYFIDSVFILVWQSYHEAIKKWIPHRPRHPLEIAREDALALEKIGFYVEETKHVLEDEFAGMSRRDRGLKGVERRLDLTDAGWDFINVVFQPNWPENTNRGFLRNCLSVRLNRVK